MATHKPLGSIPGPKSLPIIGTLWSYLPLIGEYSFEKLHHNGLTKYHRHGNIIREEFVPGVNTIWLTDPDDFKAMFKAEGKCPMRRSHLALEKFRNDRKDIYSSAGLLPTNGPEWYRLRTAIQKKLSRPQEVAKYIPPVNNSVDDFIDYLENLRKNDLVPKCLLSSLSRLYLDLICVVIFKAQLKSFEPEQLQHDSITSKLMQAAVDTNSAILSTDNGLPLWKYIDTPLYKQLKEAQIFMESVALQFVNSDEIKSSIIDDLLTEGELDYKDVIGFATDMLLAGIDTTSYTTSFVLYHLAKNPDVQEKLYEEIKSLPDGPITSEVLANAKFTKCVLKESLRLNPISIGVGRIIQNDAVFSGYEVPKGTVCVTMNQISCKLSKYFESPEKFIPERWDRSSQMYKPHNPYLTLPFGHGARSCIARRLAEQNMLIVIIKMVRKFRLEWDGVEYLDTKSYTINKPDGNVQLKLHLRE